MSTSEYASKAPAGLLVKQTQGEEYQGSGVADQRATGPEIEESPETGVDPAIRARVWRLAMGLSVGFWMTVALLGLRGCFA